MTCEPEPSEDSELSDIVGYMQETARVIGDIITPIDEIWEAMQD